MNTITTTVKSVNIVRTGVDKNGHPWTLLNVIAEDGKRYSTFDEEYMKAAGKTITFTYEEKESDKINPHTQKPYMNRNIVDEKKSAKEPSGMQAWAERLVAKVKELETRIEKLERPPLQEGEIDPDSIPF